MFGIDTPYCHVFNVTFFWNMKCLQYSTSKVVHSGVALIGVGIYRLWHWVVAPVVGTPYKL